MLNIELKRFLLYVLDSRTVLADSAYQVPAKDIVVKCKVAHSVYRRRYDAYRRGVLSVWQYKAIGKDVCFEILGLGGGCGSRLGACEASARQADPEPSLTQDSQQCVAAFGMQLDTRGQRTGRHSGFYRPFFIKDHVKWTGSVGFGSQFACYNVDRLVPVFKSAETKGLSPPFLSPVKHSAYRRPIMHNILIRKTRITRRPLRISVRKDVRFRAGCDDLIFISEKDHIYSQVVLYDSPIITHYW